MKEQLAVQHLLHQHLLKAQSKNPSYSLRSFAIKLGIGAGPLSQILSGKRRISEKMAVHFCDRLLLDPTETKQVLKSFATRGTTRPTDSINPEEVLQLTTDQFRVISDWYNYAVLSLIKTRGFNDDPAYIASRLMISKLEASQAMERLERLGMIEKQNGKWVHTRKRYRTTDNQVSLSLRKAHVQNLRLAEEALEQVPVELRDFTTITMPTDPEKLTEAKELIRKFQSDLCSLMMDTPNPTEVYRLSVELFPLTRIASKSEQEKP